MRFKLDGETVRAAGGPGVAVAPGLGEGLGVELISGLGAVSGGGVGGGVTCGLAKASEARSARWSIGTRLLSGERISC